MRCKGDRVIEHIGLDVIAVRSVLSEEITGITVAGVDGCIAMLLPPAIPIGGTSTTSAPAITEPHY